MADAARSMAAAGGTAAGMDASAGMMPEGAGAEMGEADPLAGVQEGLSMIEGALAALPPEQAAEARTHMDAIMQIVAGGAAAGTEEPAPEGAELAPEGELPEELEG